MIAYENNNKTLPRLRPLEAGDICSTISAGIFFVSWYINRFFGYKLNYLSRWCLDIWSFTDMKVLVYTQYGQNIRSFCPP